MNAPLESVSSCCGLSCWTAATPGSFSRSRALFACDAQRDPAVHGAQLLAGPRARDLGRASRRGRSSSSAVTCLRYLAAFAPFGSRRLPVTAGLVPGRPLSPPRYDGQRVVVELDDDADLLGRRAVDQCGIALGELTTGRLRAVDRAGDRQRRRGPGLAAGTWGRIGSRRAHGGQRGGDQQAGGQTGDGGTSGGAWSGRWTSCGPPVKAADAVTEEGQTWDIGQRRTTLQTLQSCDRTPPGSGVPADTPAAPA